MRVKIRFLTSLILLGGFCTIYIIPIKSQLHAESSYKELTRLRAGKPKPTYRTISGYPTRMTEIRIEIKNVGDVEAKNVQVLSNDCNGDPLQLRGESIIMPNKKAIFSTSLSVYCAKDAKIKVEVSCENCRK